MMSQRFALGSLFRHRPGVTEIKRNLILLTPKEAARAKKRYARFVKDVKRCQEKGRDCDWKVVRSGVLERKKS